MYPEKKKKSIVLSHFRLLSCFLIILAISTAAGQPFSFRKINSGTKRDIRAIIQDQQQGIYFLTDKIHLIDQDTLKKLDFPVEGNIYTVYAASSKDIWFTVNHVTNTCLLYHYHNGIVENVRSPFANQIFTIYFLPGNRALFAAIGDLAVYENGAFTMLPPSPARFYISRIFAKNITSFWMLSKMGELFLYDRGQYKPVLGGKAVTDFSFTEMQDGYILSEDALYRINTSGV
ncbi:MAG: hypothetical protein WCJ95_20285, partial [Mariniphaga sp.]